MYKIKINGLDFNNSIYTICDVYVGGSSHDDVIQNIIPKILSDEKNQYIQYEMTHIEVDDIPFDTVIRCDEESLSKRVYLSDLTLWDERVYSSINDEKTFIGRKPENSRFSVGDRVTYIWGNHIFDGYVERLPLEPGVFKDLLSYDDDSYIILDSLDVNAAHQHICSWNVFPYGYFDKWKTTEEDDNIVLPILTKRDKQDI